MNETTANTVFALLTTMEQYIVSAANAVDDIDPNTANLLDLALVNLDLTAEIIERSVTDGNAATQVPIPKDYERRIRACEVACTALATSVGISPITTPASVLGLIQSLREQVSYQDRAIGLLLKDKFDGPLTKEEFSNRYSEIPTFHG